MTMVSEQLIIDSLMKGMNVRKTVLDSIYVEKWRAPTPFSIVGALWLCALRFFDPLTSQAWVITKQGIVTAGDTTVRKAASVVAAGVRQEDQ